MNDNPAGEVRSTIHQNPLERKPLISGGGTLAVVPGRQTLALMRPTDARLALGRRQTVKSYPLVLCNNARFPSQEPGSGR
jgi:hypothetical protein